MSCQVLMSSFDLYYSSYVKKITSAYSTLSKTILETKPTLNDSKSRIFYHIGISLTAIVLLKYELVVHFKISVKYTYKYIDEPIPISVVDSRNLLVRD